MSYQIELLNKGRALLIRTGETVTMDEFTEINEKILNYSRQTSGTLHLITDMMATREHPSNDVEFKDAVNWTNEPNIGWVIYLSKNQDLNRLVDSAMDGQMYMVLDNLKAAMSIIAMDSGSFAA
jgi:hypothetical protein